MAEKSKTIKKKPKFIRRTWYKYSKIGKRRKKKQIWRKPTGRDNKMRERRKGKPSIVSIGYKKDKKDYEKLNGKIPIRVMNVKELEKMGKNNIIIIGHVGKKKKLEIANIAKEKKLEIYNMNVKTYLKRNEKVKKTDEKNKIEIKKEKIKGEEK